MLLPPAVARSAIACVAALSLSCSPLQLAPAAAAAPPSAESQSALQKAFQSAQAGSYGSADTQLSKLILEWEKTGQPDDETAALYKTRGVCRQSLGQLPAAREDLSQALRLSMTPGSKPDPAEVQRTYQLRARVNQKLGNSREQVEDLTAAIARLDQLDAIEATNPQLFKDRAEARMRTKEWAGAAEDAERAQIEFKQLGDKIRALVSAADGALALYGAGEVPEAMSKMEFVFKSKGMPASNNPDDIPQLQELSRRDAELHLAYAVQAFADGRVVEAEKQWTSGCIRLEAYVQDGENRLEAENTLRERDAQAALETGKTATPLRAASVADTFSNSEFNARLNGLDPDSPYVTQRPQQAYFWYKTSEGALERRDVGEPLAEIDPTLSCGKFRSSEWLERQRPEWSSALVQRAVAYAEAVPQKAIVMPTKEGKYDAQIRSAKRQLGVPTSELFTKDSTPGDGRPLSNKE